MYVFQGVYQTRRTPEPGKDPNFERRARKPGKFRNSTDNSGKISK